MSANGLLFFKLITLESFFLFTGFFTTTHTRLIPMYEN